MPSPSYREKKFIATRNFVGREDELCIFQDALNNEQDGDEYRVIVFFGPGGAGKTALCKQINKEIENYSDIDIGSVNIDLRLARLRTSEEALRTIRIQLKESLQISFPAFDFAFLRYISCIFPGDVKNKYPELMFDDNEYLDDIFSIAEAFLSGIPIFSVLYKHSSRFGKKTSDWFNRKGRKVLEGIDEMSPDEILQNLPKYLGSDIDEWQSKRTDNYRPSKIVFLYDTFEKIQSQNIEIMKSDVSSADNWVRELITETPGVVHIIFGRERLNWSFNDNSWGDAISHVAIKNLSDIDMHNYLDAIPIRDDSLRETIICTSRGAPFYLDMMINIYESLVNSGKEVKANDLTTNEEGVVYKYLEHIDPQLRRALRVFCQAKYFDESIYKLLTNKYLGGVGFVSYQEIINSSFFISHEGDIYELHELMHDSLSTILERSENALFLDIHEALFKLHDEMSCIEEGGLANDKNLNSLIEAAYHLQKYNAEDFLKWLVAKYSGYFIPKYVHNINALFGHALNNDVLLEKTEPKFIYLAYKVLANIRYSQMRFEDSLNIYEHSLSFLGEHDNDEIKCTYERIAAVTSRLGDYEKADQLYIKALSITGTNISHSAIRVVQHNYAVFLANHSRYDEAKKIFEAILGDAHHDNSQNYISMASLAGIYSQQEQYLKADDLLQEVLLGMRNNPKIVEYEMINVLLSSAINLRSNQKYDRAIRQLKEAISINEKFAGVNSPTNVNLIIELARCYKENNNVSRAVVRLVKAKEILSEHSNVLVEEHLEMCHLLGELYISTSKYHDAEEHYDDVIEDIKMNSSKNINSERYLNLLMNYGFTKLSINKLDEAKEIIISGIHLAKENTENINDTFMVGLSLIKEIYRSNGLHEDLHEISTEIELLKQ
ncbi:MAG: hypothetical protein KAT25_03760 [Sulfuriflexus sp.]|nr:hypothetical protein [Sulfuriflexus sp.]